MEYTSSDDPSEAGVGPAVGEPVGLEEGAELVGYPFMEYALSDESSSGTESGLPGGVPVGLEEGADNPYLEYA